MTIPVVRTSRGTNAVILSGACNTQSKAGSQTSVLCSLGCKDPDAARLAKYADTFLPAVLLFTLFAATAAHAQGCAQCLDSTRATPPAVQAAYRHAIYLLIGVASTIFLVGLYLLRRER